MNRNFTSILALILGCPGFRVPDGLRQQQQFEYDASAFYRRDHGDERIGAKSKRR